LDVWFTGTYSNERDNTPIRTRETIKTIKYGRNNEDELMSQIVNKANRQRRPTPCPEMMHLRQVLGWHPLYGSAVLKADLYPLLLEALNQHPVLSI
jgi:hypothetical protein